MIEQIGYYFVLYVELIGIKFNLWIVSKCIQSIINTELCIIYSTGLINY